MLAVLSTNAYMFLSLSFVLQVPSENGRGVTEKLTVLIPPRPESPALWGYLCQMEAWKKLEVPGVAPSLALLAVVRCDCRIQTKTKQTAILGGWLSSQPAQKHKTLRDLQSAAIGRKVSISCNTMRLCRRSRVGQGFAKYGNKLQARTVRSGRTSRDRLEEDRQVGQSSNAFLLHSIGDRIFAQVPPVGRLWAIFLVRIVDALSARLPRWKLKLTQLLLKVEISQWSNGGSTFTYIYLAWIQRHAQRCWTSGR